MSDPTKAIHHAAEAYTTAADSYVVGRPDYPSEVTTWLRDDLGLSDGRIVLDLAAGTGKFTQRLVETGAQVIAVEPVTEMLAKLSASLPLVEALTGTATQIPLADESVDAVVCAQAFHWFASAEALREMHRVLKPGGKLGLIWNMRDARVAWVAKLNAIVDRYEGDTPRFYTGAWRRAFPYPGFGPLSERHFSQGHAGSPDDVIVNRVRSTSFIAGLPEAVREKVDAELKALIDAEPLLSGKATVNVPYETAAFVAVKVNG